SESGWRWAFAIGAVPAVYALIVRWGLPESARWLATRGRTVEAERVVSDFERSAAARTGREISIRPADRTPEFPPSETEPAARPRNRIAGLWTREYRTRTASIWLVWFCVNFAYYGAFIWIPSILVDAG